MIWAPNSALLGDLGMSLGRLCCLLGYSQVPFCNGGGD
jgi:hypothetical protein